MRKLQARQCVLNLISHLRLTKSAPLFPQLDAVPGCRLSLLLWLCALEHKLLAS